MFVPSLVSLWFLIMTTVVQPTPFLHLENGDGYADSGSFKRPSETGNEVFGQSTNFSGITAPKRTPHKNTHPEELTRYYPANVQFRRGDGKIRIRRAVAANGVRDERRRWPDKTIPYQISETIGDTDREIIRNAMDEFHKKTCLKFRQRRSTDKDYVYITNKQDGCYSLVGRIGGRQTLNLQTPDCTYRIGTVIHELLHAVGFWHEHNRPDRDQYVRINHDNIKDGEQFAFVKFKETEIDNLGVEYDYGSVMHYHPTAFSRNGQTTINTKRRGAEIGQREGFSNKDLLKVLRMYKC